MIGVIIAVMIYRKKKKNLRQTSCAKYISIPFERQSLIDAA